MAPKNELMKSSSKLFKSCGDGIRNISLRSSGNSEKSEPRTSSMMSGGVMSAAEAALLVAEDYCSGEDSGDEAFDAITQSDMQTSINGEDSDDDSDDDTGSVKDLNGSVGSKKHILDSNALLAKLGPSPTAEEIASLAAIKAQEYICECFDDDSTSLDKEKFDAIPRYVKSDLLIGQFLGKGSFSDAFEVTLNVKKTVEPRKLGGDTEGDDGMDLDDSIAAAAGRYGNDPSSNNGEKPTPLSHGRNASMDPTHRRPRRATAAHLSRSVCIGTMKNNAEAASASRMTLAMKCLRPQIRADAKQFLIGVEDLIHETAILASLDHPNIIKIHGRSGGSVSDSFRLSDGYFILLDRLTDTLEDRIERWKKLPATSKKGPSVNQLKVLTSLADAILFLHRNYICFRDLKPANIGFDERGVLKMFDFGFAVTVNEDNPNSLLDKCGTLRYMAPEVGKCKENIVCPSGSFKSNFVFALPLVLKGLGLGYGLEADIFSVGVIMWEVCSLKKPFAKVKSVAEFEELVFVKDSRPKIGKKWPTALKNLMSECWARDPKERPDMSVVKSILVALTEEQSRRNANANGRFLGQSIRSSIVRRVTWD